MRGLERRARVEPRDHGLEHQANVALNPAWRRPKRPKCAQGSREGPPEATSPRPQKSIKTVNWTERPQNQPNRQNPNLVRQAASSPLPRSARTFESRARASFLPGGQRHVVNSRKAEKNLPEKRVREQDLRLRIVRKQREEVEREVILRKTTW